MKLILKDKTAIDVLDTSSIELFSFVAKDFKEVEKTYSKLTDENLKRCTLNGVEHLDVTKTATTANVIATGVLVSVSTSTPSMEEHLQKQVQEQAQAIADLGAMVAELAAKEGA